MSIDEVFKAVAKTIKDDPFASIHKAGDLSLDSYIPFGVLTGVPQIDLHIGKPGWPAGKCIELYGFEHCGKTTLGYHAIAQAQKVGGSGFFIDTEKSWDEQRATQIGVDIHNRLRIVDADSIEGVFRTIQAIIESRQKYDTELKPMVVVVDSITGTATQQMHAKKIGDEERVGQDARAIRGGMRRITGDLAKSKINLIMINHATSLVAATRYAKQSDSAGGHGIKLLSTIRCSMRGAGWITEEDNKEIRLGQKISLKIEKLKNSAVRYPEVRDIPLLNTIGFDTTASLLEAGKLAGWVKHEKNSKDYALGQVDFGKDDWPAIVSDHGGIDMAYKEFIDWCIAEGYMTPWYVPV